MDDYFVSFENNEQAVKTSQDLVKLPNLGGFVWFKFASNVEEITFARRTEVNETPSPIREICNAEQMPYAIGLKEHIGCELRFNGSLDKTIFKD